MKYVVLIDLVMYRYCVKPDISIVCFVVICVLGLCGMKIVDSK